MERGSEGKPLLEANMEETVPLKVEALPPKVEPAAAVAAKADVPASAELSVEPKPKDAAAAAAVNLHTLPLEERLALARRGPTLIFDGVCNLCNVSMRWYYDRLQTSAAESVYFMWAQHQDTKILLKELGIRPGDIMKSWAYLEDEIMLRGSTAWFAAMRHLKQPWRTLSLFNSVPEILREGAYGVVASNRYRLAGKSEVCQRPAPAMKRRFLHDPNPTAAMTPAAPANVPVAGDGPARLLVMGLGPAGLNIVKELYSEFSIIAVDTKDYYEFTPGILRGLVDPNQLKHQQVSLADVLKGLGVTFVRGAVVGLHDHSAEVRLLAPLGEGAAATGLTGEVGSVTTVPFDYAAIAVGSQYSGQVCWKVTGAPGEESQMTLEGRGAELARAREQLLQLREQGGTAVVVGTGLVGVELAAELADFIPGLKVVLVGMMDVLLPALPAEAQEHARQWMERHGVELRLGQPVPAGGEVAALGLSGPCMVLSCVGVAMRNEFAKPLDCLDESGAICVNHMMQVLKREPSPEDQQLLGPERARVCGTGRIFALGDCVRVVAAAVPLGRDTYTAEAMAGVVIANLRRAKTVHCLRTCPGVLSELRLPLNQFTICSLGKDDAIFVANGMVMSTGWPAVKAKQAIESTKMGQYRQELLGSLIWKFVPHW